MLCFQCYALIFNLLIILYWICPQEASGDATTPKVNGDDKPETKESEEKAEKKDDETETKEPQTPDTPVDDAKSPEEDKSEKKKKDKPKKMKWSFRSISFTKKDKTKPNMSKDDSITSDLSKAADAVAEVSFLLNLLYSVFQL